MRPFCKTWRNSWWKCRRLHLFLLCCGLRSMGRLEESLSRLFSTGLGSTAYFVEQILTMCLFRRSCCRRTSLRSVQGIHPGAAVQQRTVREQLVDIPVPQGGPHLEQDPGVASLPHEVMLQEACVSRGRVALFPVRSAKLGPSLRGSLN